MNEPRGASPFHPGQLVPADLFTGRQQQLDWILSRGVGQVAHGKPVNLFVQGEYGIGKSSLAAVAQFLAERDHGLHPIYATLGTSRSLTDVAAAIASASLRSGTFDPRRVERIRNWLAKYIGKQSVLGVSLNLEALRNDAPSLADPTSLLDFFAEALNRLTDTGVQGLFVVLDEIDAIASQDEFPHLVKDFVDNNGRLRSPLPILLLICGTEQKRHEMIRRYSPINRVLDVVDVPLMSDQEMNEFFLRAFESVGMSIKEAALSILTHYSAGLPKIMHEIGDAAFWVDEDGVIDAADATRALYPAANAIGQKYVEPEVFDVIRSADYRSILEKIALSQGPVRMDFRVDELQGLLTSSEARKLNNFLQRMKRLEILRSGDNVGEYVFAVRMVRFYIWLQGARERDQDNV